MLPSQSSWLDFDISVQDILKISVLFCNALNSIFPLCKQDMVTVAIVRVF